MNPTLVFLWARLAEPSTYAGLAAFFGAAGATMISSGFTAAGAVVGAVAAGCSAVSIFLKEGK
jgi:hypothetical protein